MGCENKNNLAKTNERSGLTLAGMVAYIIPCVSLLLGWGIGETISMAQVVAMGSIFLMVALVQWEGQRIVERGA